MLALIDCNSFYCSCELVFRPDLMGKPVVVLSNNDGCVIARNKQAKELGIPMGAVKHEYDHILKKYNVAVFSSNFALYADISSRIMKILGQFSPKVDIYSIDEAFIELPVSDNYIEYGQTIHKTILKQTGIPVSIGIAPTKVLTKCANYWAKKLDVHNVYALINDSIIKESIKKIPIGDVWGIGRKQAQKCKLMKIDSAYDFQMYKNESKLKSVFTKVGHQIQQELNGVSCMEISDIESPRKSIRSSKSFKPELSDIEDIAAALSLFATRAMEKCRNQHSVCQCVTIFIHTNPFKNTRQYSNAITVGLHQATNDTLAIVALARHLLKKIYVKGYAYKKAGIIITNFSDEQYLQQSLFQQPSHNQPITQAMDAINRRFGQDKCQVASNLRYQNKKTSPSHISNRYTTNWNELLIV